MTTNASPVAEEARALIARKRIRQPVIAKALGLSQAAVSRRLTGDVDFYSGEVKTLAALLEVPVGVLYGDPMPVEVDSNHQPADESPAKSLRAAS